MTAGIVALALALTAFGGGAAPVLHGDGVGDDTDAIQALIDSGRGVVKLPRPAKHYLISRTLKFGSGSGLELDADTLIRLAPGSSCPLAANADPTGGNESIKIIGGIWDMDNVNQAPNPGWQQLCMPPREPLRYPEKYDPDFYRGNAFYFETVKGFTFRNVTIRNPVTYAFQICRVTDFTVEHVTFDFTACNPVRGNMDGIHLDGGCHRGRIAHLRGACFDDMVALNANDGFCNAHEEEISDIEIEDVQADYCHSALRMLSVDAPVRRVKVRNVRGHFYAYAIGFTHYFPKRPEVGLFEDISISDVKVGKAPAMEENPWKTYVGKLPTFFYDEKVRLVNVKIDDFEVLPPLKELPEPFRTMEGVKVSERFGFDPVDSTRFLQAALDSGLPKIVIDAKNGPWHTLPLRSRTSNQTIVFEEGAYVVAKRGEFQNPYTSRLITFEGCTNLTIRGTWADRCGFRMWREDYADRARYKWSEWRHGISLLSCANVTLFRISSNGSGGDGLYISAGGGRDVTRENHWPNCRNVVVRGCVFDRNYRQGISVISAENLLIEDTVMSNTQGTDPQAGIDFEPNEPWECLKNVVLRRCKSLDNWGMAFDILTIKYDSTSEPLDIRFEDCESTGGLHALRYGNSVSEQDTLIDDGLISFADCRFARSRQNAVHIGRKPYSTGSVAFRNCTFEDCGLEKPDAADIAVNVSGHPGEKAGAYVFENVTVRQRKTRPALDFVRRDGAYDGKPTRIEGRITTVGPDGKASVRTYDDDWNRTNLPYVPAKPLVARVAAPLEGVTVVDRSPGEASACEPVFYRGSWTDKEKPYVIYAAKAGTAHLRLMQAEIGARTFKTGANPIGLFRFGETEPASRKAAVVPEDPEGGVVEIALPAPGFYELDVQTGGNGVAVLSSDVPIALNCAKSLMAMVGPMKGPAASKYGWSKGLLYFWVPSGRTFANLLVGEGAENAALEIIDPDGKTAWVCDTITDVGCCQRENAAEGLWCAKVGRPKRGAYEDFKLGLYGIPGWYFLCKDKYWK